MFTIDTEPVDSISTLIEKVAQTPHNNKANVAIAEAIVFGTVGLAFPPALAGAGVCAIASAIEIRQKEIKGEKLDY